MLNQEELQALRFYEGDTEGKDPFWSDPKAYVTLNSLLFSGIDTEKARAAEKRKLNLEMLVHYEETLGVFQNLISALRKDRHGNLHVWRVERLTDYQCFRKEGMFTSFISTSTAGFLKAYEDKFDLVLMDIEIGEDVIAGNLQKLLPYYAKQEEAEVLLAPYCKVTFEEEPLPAEYKEIRDGHGREAAVFVKTKVSGNYRKEKKTSFNKEDIPGAVSFYESLNEGKKSREEDLASYLRMKKYFRTVVMEKLV